jgi:putative PIN family toxin of toxin-antitoxin system
MRNKKIILDTNLWISFLISKKLNDIDDLIYDGKIVLIFLNELIEEFLTVAKRSKFIKYFTDSDLEDLMKLFDKYGKLVKVHIQISECRDFKDNFLLSLAVDSKADFLITGDSDLLILKNIKKTKICTWNDFLDKLK